MPPRSTIALMPAEQRAALEREIVARGFADFRGLEDWLRESYGIELSYTKIWKHSDAMRRKLEAVRASTAAARQIAEAAPDDADLRSAAVMSMVQTEIFDVLVQLQEADAETDPAERLKVLGRAADGIAALSRASVAQKRWQAEVEAKVKSAADKIEAVARAGGLTAEELATIRREVYGITA